MSTEAGSPAKKDVTSATKSPENKGKGKGKAEDISMEEEEEEEEEEGEEEEEEEDDDEMEEDHLEEIDPSAITSRRTRGVRVDYTSAEALKKAGLEADHDDDDDDDEGMEH